MSKRDYPLDFFLSPMKPANPPRTASGIKKLEQIFASEDYVAEEKFDGCRYFSIGGRLFSPRISDVDGMPVEKTLQVGHIAAALHRISDKLILDGEIYYPGWKSQDVITITGSLPDVARAKQVEAGILLRYAVFDVLRDAEGNWVTSLPWYMRRQYLEALFADFRHVLDTSCAVDLVPVVTGARKRAYLDELLSEGKEGIVLKNIYQKYYIGKRPAWNWIKCKVQKEDDVVIMGFEPPERLYTGKCLDAWMYWAWPAQPVDENEIITFGACPGSDWVPVTKYYARGWIGSVVFGKYDAGGNLVRLGTCSGMDESMRAEFSQTPEKYIGRVMKVKLMEYTRDGAYRHCRFDGLHEDKNPLECRL